MGDSVLGHELNPFSGDNSVTGAIMSGDHHFTAGPGGIFNDTLGTGPKKPPLVYDPRQNGAPPPMPGYYGENQQYHPYAVSDAQAATYNAQGYSPTQTGSPATYQGQGYDPSMLGDPRIAQADRSGLDAYRNFATGTGDSPWAQAALDQERLGTQSQRDALPKQQAAQVQGAQDRLAMGGGLSGGGAERLATQGAQAGLAARQDLEKGSLDRQAGIRTQDAQARQGFLQNLPGQDLSFANFDKSNADTYNQFAQQNQGAQNSASQFGAAAKNQSNAANADIINQFDQFNTTNQNQAAATNAAAANSAGQYNAGAKNQANQFNVGARNANNQFAASLGQNDTAMHNAFNLGNYNTAAGIYGGQNMAGATSIAAANASKGGGSSFVCTELRRRGMMSLRESKEMVDFMLRGLCQRADFFAWYFENGERLVKVAQNFCPSWDDVKKATVTDVLKLIRAGKELDAQNAYISAIARMNVQLGLPMGPMKESIRRPGLVKSVFALPGVFALASTWRWARAHYGEKAARRMKKSLRRVA